MKLLTKTLLIFFILQTGLILGQNFNGSDIGSIRSNYSASYVTPTATGVNMAVNIWGEVKAPGQYLIPYSINLDLVTLLSHAGGPTEDAKLKDVIIIREVDEGMEPVRILIDLKSFIKTGDRTILPTIQPNDTVIIQPSWTATFKRKTGWVDVLYRFATIYLLIDRYSK